MGVALARRRKGIDAVALGFCGDGATCGGVFHETLNLAAVWRAPLVVIVERNGYAYMTPEDRYLPVSTIASRADGYGISAWVIDGNDVAQVHEGLSQALASARRGDGPALVEALTYRMHGHGAHDAQTYVPPQELELWRAKDPLLLWRQRAEQEIHWTTSQQEALDQTIAEHVANAVREALDAPYPDPADLAVSVFA